MAIILSKVEPEVCEYSDPEGNSLTIEVVLPGVSKQNIKLKVRTDSILISATSDNTDYSKYIYLNQAVIPNMVKAVYEHGLLRITLPLRT